MARQDYMTIAVQKSTQEIFRKFVEVKDLTVKEALSDVLEMYFAMNQDNIDNDIAYVADVEEIISYTQPTVAPCKEHEYPEEWAGGKNNIWIKIRNLKEESNLKANDFVIVSTGNSLKEVIQKGQYIFGYIRRKKNKVFILMKNWIAPVISMHIIDITGFVHTHTMIIIT